MAKRQSVRLDAGWNRQSQLIRSLVAAPKIAPLFLYFLIHSSPELALVYSAICSTLNTLSNNPEKG